MKEWVAWILRHLNPEQIIQKNSMQGMSRVDFISTFKPLIFSLFIVKMAENFNSYFKAQPCCMSSYTNLIARDDMSIESK